MQPRTSEPVSLAVAGSVAIVTMAHEPYNLLGPALLDPLIACMDEAVADGARAIVIRSGLRHFSAGADLSLFDRTPAADDMANGSPTSPSTRTPAMVLDQLTAIPVPVVASIHGVCLGGGFELALACDFIVATRSSKIGSVEATLGLHPLMGAIQRVAQRAGEARAKEMAMLARRYDAATLERWNLINLVVNDEDLESATAALADELAAGPTVAHAATKALVRVAIDRGVRSADEEMAQIQRPIWASEDLAIGLASFAKSGPGTARFGGN